MRAMLQSLHKKALRYLARLVLCREGRKRMKRTERERREDGDVPTWQIAAHGLFFGS